MDILTQLFQLCLIDGLFHADQTLGNVRSEFCSAFRRRLIHPCVIQRKIRLRDQCAQLIETGQSDIAHKTRDGTGSHMTRFSELLDSHISHLLPVGENIGSDHMIG